MNKENCALNLVDEIIQHLEVNLSTKKNLSCGNARGGVGMWWKLVGDRDCNKP